MSHFVKVPGEKRVSLETLQVAPGSPLTLGVWGWKDDLGLSVVALNESGQTTDFCTIKMPVGAPKDRRVLTFSKEGTYRIELKQGESMWDWLRVAATKNAANSADYKATGSGTLGLEVFWVGNGGSQKPMTHYITVATLLAERHGFKLDIKGGEYSEPRKLKMSRAIVTGVGDDNGNLGVLSAELKEKIEYTKGDRLVVIVGSARQMEDEAKDPKNLNGMCIESKHGAVGKPYLLINGDRTSADGATLFHEMCHAAGYHHGDKEAVEDNDPKNVMSYGERRNLVHKDRIETLKNAFFRKA